MQGEPGPPCSGTQPPPFLSFLLPAGPLCPHVPDASPAARLWGRGFLVTALVFISASSGARQCAHAMLCWAGLSCSRAPPPFAVTLAPVCGREASAPGPAMLLWGLGLWACRQTTCAQILVASFAE